jgi:hypothetical protein
VSGAYSYQLILIKISTTEDMEKINIFYETVKNDLFFPSNFVD